MTAMRRNYKTMTAALKAAINDSELSFKGLERETGVKRQSMMKFVAGEQSLRLDVADKLAAYFGLEIVKRKEK
jgi:plasmid maintenance system antidote protein VapI